MSRILALLVTLSSVMALAQEVVPLPSGQQPYASPLSAPANASMYVPPAASPQPAAAPAAQPVPQSPLVAAQVAPATVVEVKPPPKVWEGSVELGVNGTEGNSQTLNLRGGAKLKRKTEANVLSAELDYRKDSADSVSTANKAFLDSRYEHFFGSSPWTFFTHVTLDHDEFQAYDLRLAADTGLGYRFIKNDLTTLTGRLGGGTSREFGGPNDEWVPEAVFGLEYEQKINARHKLSWSAEYRPDVTDFMNYRLIGKAAWEILLDEAMHLSLKLGAADRYDSTPEGKKPNDLDYSLVLLWSF